MCVPGGGDLRVENVNVWFIEKNQSIGSWELIREVGKRVE